jgi:membrane-associated protein
MEWFQTLLNSQDIIQKGGLLLITVIVFLENGMFFGFFLPGDYLLFSAGLLCGTGDFDVPIVTLVACVCGAAIIGSYAGYWFGRTVGRNLYKKEDSLFFKRKHVAQTRLYFSKFGGRTLVFGRFLPIIRTFAPIFAGVIELNIREFSLFNIVGALVWVFGLVLGGYFLGVRFPGLLHYIEYIIFGFFAVTTFIVARTLLRVNKNPKQKMGAV